MSTPLLRQPEPSSSVEDVQPALGPLVASNDDVDHEAEAIAVDLAPAKDGLRSDWLTTVIPISAGGFLGANARYLAGLWAAEQWGMAFPWGTLLINVAGSFVLGFYLTLVTERFVGRPTTHLFLGTGFLGAFTTFSTLSYEAVRLLSGASPATGLAYVGGTLVLGLVAAVAGILCAHAL